MTVTLKSSLSAAFQLSMLNLQEEKLRKATQSDQTRKMKRSNMAVGLESLVEELYGPKLRDTLKGGRGLGEDLTPSDPAFRMADAYDYYRAQVADGLTKSTFSCWLDKEFTTAGFNTFIGVLI